MLAGKTYLEIVGGFIFKERQYSDSFFLHFVGFVYQWQRYFWLGSILFLTSFTGLLAQIQDTTQAYVYRQKADYFYKGDHKNYDSALHYYDLAATHFEDAKAYQRAGNSLLRKGNCFIRKKTPQEAIPVFKKCIKVLQNIYADDDLNMISVNRNLFSAYLRSGKPFEGQPYLFKAYEIGKQHKDENLRAYAGTLETLGYFYNEIGDPNKAKQYYLEVAPIYLELLGPTSSRLSATYVNIGIQLDILGDVERSIEYFESCNQQISYNLKLKKYLFSKQNL